MRVPNLLPTSVSAISAQMFLTVPEYKPKAHTQLPTHRRQRRRPSGFHTRRRCGLYRARTSLARATIVGLSNTLVRQPRQIGGFVFLRCWTGAREDLV